MTYGRDIGKKFYEDGSVRRYPGNTVVAPIREDSAAYAVMKHLRERVIELGMDKYLILLPINSYHMTVIRGVNDQVRKDTHWPKALPMYSPMSEVDDYMERAITAADIPGPVRMRFDKVVMNDGDVKVVVAPADDEEKRTLLEFRDRAADSIGLHLPGHDNYVFHITLAYTRVIPEGEDEVRMNEMIEGFCDYVADKGEFWTSAPHVAFYDDMLKFSPTRVKRDN